MVITHAGQAKLTARFILITSFISAFRKVTLGFFAILTIIPAIWGLYWLTIPMAFDSHTVLVISGKMKSPSLKDGAPVKNPVTLLKSI